MVVLNAAGRNKTRDWRSRGSSSFGPTVIIRLTNMTTRLWQLLVLNSVLTGTVVAAAWAVKSPFLEPEPIGGTAGLFMVPGEIADGRWGCYLLDIDAATLVTYQLDAKSSRLELASSRIIAWDRRLKNFNTHPSPADVVRIARLIEESRKLRDQGR